MLPGKQRGEACRWAPTAAVDVLLGRWLCGSHDTQGLGSSGRSCRHGWASRSSCPYRRGSAPSPTAFLSPPPYSGVSPRPPPWPEATASFALAALVLAPEVPVLGHPSVLSKPGSWPFYPRPTSLSLRPHPPRSPQWSWAFTKAWRGGCPEATSATPVPQGRAGAAGVEAVGTLSTLPASPATRSKPGTRWEVEPMHSPVLSPVHTPGRVLLEWRRAELQAKLSSQPGAPRGRDLCLFLVYPPNLGTRAWHVVGAP